MDHPLFDLARELGTIGLALVLLFLGKLCLGLLSPFSIDDEPARDNPAFGLSLIGYYLAILIIFVGAVIGDGRAAEPGWTPLALDGAYAAGGIVLLNLSRWLTDKLVLPSFSTRKEIVEDRNVGVGAVEFGIYVGSALILAGALSGRGGPLPALAFFALGQLGLIFVAWIYRRIAAYDFHGDFERDNAAAGVAFGGVCIAIGIVLMRGTGGDFVSWRDNLMRFAWYFVVAFALLVVGRYAIDYILMPRRTLKQEIVEDRNVNAGYLEGGLIGLAAVLSVVL